VANYNFSETEVKCARILARLLGEGKEVVDFHALQLLRDELAVKPDEFATTYQMMGICGAIEQGKQSSAGGKITG
jgi:hypothetical protein